ncbi:titin homolog [Mercenaria mercenaria]|uniref:titin homolog n=1 Tax=Mercenaria mercenaria TaxID=6596 RepID=UPI00234FB054|nr:titin homolog [Mercenaria mercenaria]
MKMKRIPLSERFSHIKAVTVDSTESDTDFSDNDLIARSSSNRFSYSNTAAFSFTGNTDNKTVEDEHENDDSDEEIFYDLESEWTEHFKKTLLKSRNLSGVHEKSVSLFDRVPQVDSRVPLQYLQDGLDHYKLSQGSDDVTIERNETAMDICKDDDVDEIGAETAINVADGIDIEQIGSINADIENTDTANGDIVADKTNKLVITEPVQISTVNKETDIDATEIICVPIHINHDTKTANKVETGTESFQSEIGLPPELEDLGNCKSAGELESPVVQEPLSKTENEEVIEDENTETIVVTTSIEDSRDISDENKTVLPENTENTNVLESLNALSLDKENEKCVPSQLLKNTEASDARKTEETVVSELPKEPSLETVETAPGHQESSIKELNIDETLHSKNHDKSKDEDVLVKLYDSSVPKQDKEKTGNKKRVSQQETKLKNVSQKCNKEKMKNNSVTQSKKESKKIKTVDIKPTFSFPLDELLPAVPTKKRKASEDVKTTGETTAVARKRHTSETKTNETKQNAVTEEVLSNPVAPHPFIESDIFHGTVYDSSPKEDLSETLYHQHSNFEDLDETPLPSGSGKDTFENEFDSGMSSLILALQNGNQQVISMFQAALHDQIGSNLEALAFKAKQGQQFAPNCVNEEQTSFGFYTERTECAHKDPDETGDNLTKDKYDELLNLFVAQCSALVKTDEDRSKLKSLMKVLQKEGEMKLTSTGFTPPTEIEPNTHHDVPKSLDLSSVSTSLDSYHVGSSLVDKHEGELFEGRTLLKGGVEPRHIPKTTVRKPGQDLPKDPRSCLIGERSISLVKVPLPQFAVELYGEKKVKKMIHLDWDAQFSLSRSQSTLAKEKNPRMKNISPIDSDLKLIVDATKTLVESLQTATKNAAIESKTVQQNKAEQADQIPVLIDKKITSEIRRGKGTENDKNKTIPVLITPQKEMLTTQVLDSSEDRNPVLRCINKKSSLTNDSSKQEKKPCIGVVKPLVEQHKPKDTKPSVGIVKPIQLQTSSVKLETKSKSKRNTTTPSMTSLNLEQKFDIEDGEIQVDNVIEKCKDKTSLSGANQQIVTIELDSDSEEGEIRMDEERQVSEKGKIGTKSDSSSLTKGHNNRKKEVNYKSGQSNNKIATQHLLETFSNTNKINISFSDVSSCEDGQIDTDLDKSFKEEVVKIDKRDRSRDKDRSSRHYRKRDRSSSRSSIESRLSHSSRNHYRDEERKYYSHKSTRRGSSREKSRRRDRSRSRERSWLRSPSEEKSYSKHKHRHRHHTSKDERSDKEFSDRSETSKRHHSACDEKRKRHKTEEDYIGIKTDKNKYASEVYFKSASSQRVTSVYGETDAKKSPIQKSNLPQTSSVSYLNTGDEDLLSDADIAKEYHEKFGKSKTANTNTVETDRLTFSYNSGNSLAGKKYPCFTASRSRRKSWEDQQRQVLEDKKFLEKCKQKILGKSATVSKLSVPDQTAKYCSSKQKESTICKPRSTSCVSSSYNEMLDLEDGEIQAKKYV